MKILINGDQRGIALPAIIAIVIAVLLAGGGVFYFMNKDKDEDASINSSQQAGVECTKEISDEDLCKLASAYDPKSDFTVAMTGTREGQTYVTTIRFDEGNYHSTTEVGDQLTSEMIHHDGATYMKNTDSDSWIKYPQREEENTEPEEEPVPELDFNEESIPNYTSKGKEVCGDLTCFRYDFNDPDLPNSAYSIWFDDQEYKVRKISTNGTEGSLDITYTYGDVTVDAPENFTELPGGGNTETPSQEQIQQMIEQYAQ